MVQPDEIIRSNRKTLAICIDAQNRVIVRAPKSCAEERIFAFLTQKEDWILRKRAEKSKYEISLPTENLHGYQFLLLGKTCTLFLTQEKEIRFDNENYHLFLPSKNSENRLKSWLKENGKRIFTEVAKKQADIMQTSFKSVTVNSAKGRWGSCSFDNALHFSFRLLYAPKAVIEYVVLHELAHTKHKNHSPRFWAEVEKYNPDWKTHRKWLKLHGGLMKIF